MKILIVKKGLLKIIKEICFSNVFIMPKAISCCNIINIFALAVSVQFHMIPRKEGFSLN